MAWHAPRKDTGGWYLWTNQHADYMEEKTKFEVNLISLGLHDILNFY